MTIDQTNQALSSEIVCDAVIDVPLIQPYQSSWNHVQTTS